MRIFAIAAAAAAMLAAPARAAGPDEAAVMAALNGFVDLVNKGDAPHAAERFTANPTIVEDLAPYHWTGPGAPMAWLGAMAGNADKAGYTSISMKLAAPVTVLTSGATAYAVVPGDLAFGLKGGGVRHIDGRLTFALEKVAGDWKIHALTWAWERDRPR